MTRAAIIAAAPVALAGCGLSGLPVAASWMGVGTFAALVAVAVALALSRGRSAQLAEAVDEARALRAIGEAIPGVYYTVCPPDASGGHPVSVSWGGLLGHMGLKRGEAVGTYIEDWVRDTDLGMGPYARAFERGHYDWEEALSAPNGRRFRLEYHAEQDHAGRLACFCYDVSRRVEETERLRADRDRVSAEGDRLRRQLALDAERRLAGERFSALTSGQP